MFVVQIVPILKISTDRGKLSSRFLLLPQNKRFSNPSKTTKFVFDVSAPLNDLGKIRKLNNNTSNVVVTYHQINILIARE
jgi:hypothetical protein